MPKIILKSARRKTQVSRNRVRSVMVKLFGKPAKLPVKKKSAVKIPVSQ